MRNAPMHAQRGLTLIEVLITMVILAIGLLGLVGLQARLQVLQIEAYQRAQALMLLRDMSSRIANNRNNAVAYVTASPVGVGNCPALPGTPTRRDRDVFEWCSSLQGASEESNAGAMVGAMVGGRGCVENLGAGQFMVTVAWQGMAPLGAPPESVTCGLNLYNGGAGSVCVSDLCRRVVTNIVRIADLTS
jgi:type IV pilus assembly protein PilV